MLTVTTMAVRMVTVRSLVRAMMMMITVVSVTMTVIPEIVGTPDPFLHLFPSLETTLQPS